MNETPIVTLIRLKLALPVVHSGLTAVLELLLELDELDVGGGVSEASLVVSLLGLESVGELAELSVGLTLCVDAVVPATLFFFLPPVRAKTPATINATTTTAAMMP
jgi:hypothetical protein